MTNTSAEQKPAILIIGSNGDAGADVSADHLTVTHHDCNPLTISAESSESAAHLMRQFDSLQDGVEVSAVKVGLVANMVFAQAAHDILKQLADVPVILTFDTDSQIEADEVFAFINEHLLPLADVLVVETQVASQWNRESSHVEANVNALLQSGVQHCLVVNAHVDEANIADYYASREASFYCYQGIQELNNSASKTDVLASSLASHLASGQDIRDAVVLAKAYWHRGVRLSEMASANPAFKHSSQALALQDLPKLCYQQAFIGKQFAFASCPDRLGIYPVVDSADWVEKLVACGIQTIQLRVKDQAAEQLTAQIAQVTAYLQSSNVNFFLNDYWQLAIEHKAYGVHLGQEDLHDAQLDAISQAGLRLGVSTHSYWELARALAVNPSYIALGPIYATTSKQMPFSPQGEARLQQWVHLLADHYPLVAIGGIDLPRAKQLKKTGVGSVAMISAITKAEDYQEATRALLNCWDES